MPESAETEAFIRNSFRSVWTLELLLLLKSESERFWSQSELVERLRGSDLVVRQGIEALVAGGLILVEEGGSARYAPVSPDMRRLVDNAERIYAKKPDAVRRLIVLSANDQLAAFAEAFRLRKD
ncbi:MAG TPA: hypothetical protein VNT25_03660 [Allosphingosinicella sp.]|nr:hypothetical protein [Allosphingosinicella sp.]